MGHATTMFDLTKHDVNQLEKALRNLPIGGAIKLAGSGLALKRVHGGRAFLLDIPPRVRRPIGIPIKDLKSAQTAAPALAAAHEKVTSDSHSH